MDERQLSPSAFLFVDFSINGETLVVVHGHRHTEALTVARTHAPSCACVEQRAVLAVGYDVHAGLGARWTSFPTMSYTGRGNQYRGDGRGQGWSRGTQAAGQRRLQGRQANGGAGALLASRRRRPDQPCVRNRSACLFALGRYDECAKDIEACLPALASADDEKSAALRVKLLRRRPLCAVPRRQGGTATPGPGRAGGCRCRRRRR